MSFKGGNALLKNILLLILLAVLFKGLVFVMGGGAERVPDENYGDVEGYGAIGDGDGSGDLDENGDSDGSDALEDVLLDEVVDDGLSVEDLDIPLEEEGVF